MDDGMSSVCSNLTLCTYPLSCKQRASCGTFAITLSRYASRTVTTGDDGRPSTSMLGADDSVNGDALVDCTLGLGGGEGIKPDLFIATSMSVGGTADEWRGLGVAFSSSISEVAPETIASDASLLNKARAYVG